MSEPNFSDLEVKIAFLERHIEEMDKAFLAVNDQIHTLNRAVERLAAQQKKSQSPGGEESREDAVPPHY